MAEKNRGPNGLKAIFVVLIVFGGLIGLGLLGVLVGNYIVMPLMVGKGNVVEVPDVIGLPMEEAIVLLEEKGFEAVADERKPDTLFEADRVIEQKPHAGSKAKKGRLVQLVVSSGEESVRVPYLLGLTFEQANSIAERRGFKIATIDTVQNDTFPSGRIVAMKPDPEIRVKPGTELHVYISAGPSDKTLITPNLIDLPLARAEEILEADSLVMGEVRKIEVAGKGGIVVLQSPDAGVPISPGDTVNVIIGQEP